MSARWWVATPGRLLANYAFGVAFLVCWWTAIVVFHAPDWWLIWSAACTPLVLLPTVIYGPRVWRAWRDERSARRDDSVS